MQVKARVKDKKLVSEKRRLIIDGAIKVFKKKGYHKATIREIAKEAKIEALEQKRKRLGKQRPVVDPTDTMQPGRICKALNPLDTGNVSFYSAAEKKSSRKIAPQQIMGCFYSTLFTQRGLLREDFMEVSRFGILSGQESIWRS